MVNSISRGMAFMILLGMSCVVRGSTLLIEAVPGQNVYLPCMVDQVNDQQTVKWWSHNSYFSSGKEILDSVGTLKDFFAIPGAGADYSLFIMIPDDMDIWEHFIETYECRCYRKNVKNSSDQSTSSLQTMNVSSRPSGGVNFSNVSRDGNEAHHQTGSDTVQSLNSQSIDNTLYQESNTAMQTFQQTEDNTALYHEVCELSDATHQTMGSIGIINDVNVDLDTDGYLEIQDTR